MATSVNNIRTSLNDKLVERQNALDAEIRALEEKKRYYGEAVQAFSELLPNLEKPLSKLHLELVNMRMNYGREPGSGYGASIEVRTLDGFRYLARDYNADRNYTKLSNKAERMGESLLKALKPYGVDWVNVNPFSLQGGTGGHEVGDTVTIQITIKK